MQLPRNLEPWRVWLSLFPPDLIDPVGALLLRLHPLVGRLSSAARDPSDERIGVGDVVRRGLYERLLMTEWLYADAEPNEFIRRAANGELLFTGPEPESRLRSRRCVVLFDAGPSQLGEPRLAHLALFILLARRAEEAGATFQWGVLQQAGILHDATDRAGLQTLLSARTLALPVESDIAGWNAVLDVQSAQGVELRDCWQISGAGAAAPKRVRSRVTVRHALLMPQLVVGFSQGHAQREVCLDLPETASGVRLLREPFAPLAHPGRVRHGIGQPSQKQAPRFGIGAQWLAVPRLDGGAAVFHIPQMPQSKPGKVRIQKPPVLGSILAAGVFKKNLSHVVTNGDSLEFVGFPGELFSRGAVHCLRPEMDQFRAPPGLARWLPTFFLASPAGTDHSERVFLLDIEKRLVCWELKGVRRSAGAPEFKHVAGDVIGVEQFNKMLLIAREDDSYARILRINSEDQTASEIASLHVPGDRALFGGNPSRYGADFGLIGLRLNRSQWWVGNAQRECVINTDGVVVLGVARIVVKGGAPKDGLIVLDADCKSIQFKTADEKEELVRSPVPIAQAAYDPSTGRLAWLTQHPSTIIVQGLRGDKPLLHVLMQGAGDGA